MTEVKGKTANESRVFKTSRVFPTDLNDRNTLFGGKILAEMDMVASISATRHARKRMRHSIYGLGRFFTSCSFYRLS